MLFIGSSEPILWRWQRRQKVTRRQRMSKSRQLGSAPVPRGHDSSSSSQSLIRRLRPHVRPGLVAHLGRGPGWPIAASQVGLRARIGPSQLRFQALATKCWLLTSSKDISKTKQTRQVKSQIWRSPKNRTRHRHEAIDDVTNDDVRTRGTRGVWEAKMAGNPDVESCTALCFCLVVGLTGKWTDPDAVTQLGN